MRELEQIRQLARERAQEARRAAPVVRAATQQRDRLQRELVKAQARPLSRPASRAAPWPRKRPKTPTRRAIRKPAPTVGRLRHLGLRGQPFHPRPHCPLGIR